MSNEGDSNRFINETFRGVPAGYGLSREEQILKTQTKQLEEMRAMREKFSRPTAAVAYQHEPRIQMVTPQIHVDIPNVANELRPQFDNLLDSQQQLAGSVKDLGFQGQLALRESKVHSGLLTSLGDASKTAYQQRNVALNMMARSILDHGEARQSLENVGFGVRSDIQSGNAALSQIRGGIRIGNRSLHSIDQGIGKSNSLLEDLGIKIEDLECSLLSSLGELGSEISNLSRQVTQSSLQMIDAIAGFEDVFLWAHREKMTLQRKLLYSLQNPVSMQAINVWTLGERARKIGDYDQAIHLYQQSLGIDPTSPRPYFSLAMIALERGDVLLARDFMNSAIAYAMDEPELRSLIMMYSAKIERLNGDKDRSLFYGRKAFETYRYNLEVWFELALIYMERADIDQALYFIQNLLVAARKTNPGYVYKVIATPQFFHILEPIRNILSTL